MYNEIREHIRDGRLEKAFEEINELPLSRSQRDDLLLIESGHEEYLRSQLTESSDFQQRTRNRLTRDTLNLLNLIEDSQQEEKVIPTPAPAPAPATVAKASGTPWKAIVGGVAVLLIALTAYAFWPGGNNQPIDPNKSDIERLDKPEEGTGKKPIPAKPKPINPGTANFQDDSKPTATVPSGVKINPELLQPVDVSKTVLNTNVLQAITRKKTVGVVRYGGLNTTDLNAAASNIIAPQLDRLLPKLTVKPLDAPKSFYSSSTMDKLKSGTYTGGKVTGLDVDYLLIIQTKKALLGKVEFNYRMIDTSNGTYVLKHRGKILERSMIEEVPKLIAKSITNELQ